MQSVALLLLLAVPAFGASCEKGWHLFDGNCYQHFRHNGNNRVGFYQAESRCVERGAHLSTVSSQAELEFITRISRVDAVFGWGGLPLTAIHRNINGDLVHIGNEKVPPFLKWCKGEPNNSQLRENCVGLRFDAVAAGGFMAPPGPPCMHDVFCAGGYEGVTGYIRYVCKKAATEADATGAAADATAKPAELAVEAVSVKAVEVAVEAVTVKAAEAAVEVVTEKPAESATEAAPKATSA